MREIGREINVPAGVAEVPAVVETHFAHVFLDAAREAHRPHVLCLNEFHGPPPVPASCDTLVPLYLRSALPLTAAASTASMLPLAAPNFFCRPPAVLEFVPILIESAHPVLPTHPK